MDRDRKENVAQSVFVSWVVGELGNYTFDKLNKPFFDKKFDRNNIKKNSGKVTIYHGDNDPYVPISHAEKFHKELWGKLKIIEQGGHLNSEAGFDSFEEILRVI